MPIEPQPVSESLKQRCADWIDQRTAQGIETYGTPLMTHNGRSARQDAFEEILDFSQYQEQDRLELIDENVMLRDENRMLRDQLNEARAMLNLPMVEEDAGPC